MMFALILKTIVALIKCGYNIEGVVFNQVDILSVSVISAQQIL